MANIDPLEGSQSGSNCLDSLYADIVELSAGFEAHTHTTGGDVLFFDKQIPERAAGEAPAGTEG